MISRVVLRVTRRSVLAGCSFYKPYCILCDPFRCIYNTTAGIDIPCLCCCRNVYNLTGRAGEPLEEGHLLVECQVTRQGCYKIVRSAKWSQKLSSLQPRSISANCTTQRCYLQLYSVAPFNAASLWLCFKHPCRRAAPSRGACRCPTCWAPCPWPTTSCVISTAWRDPRCCSAPAQGPAATRPSSCIITFSMVVVAVVAIGVVTIVMLLKHRCNHCDA